MTEKDGYEKLCNYYEIFVGKIPERDQFKEALKKIVSLDYLDLFFNIPTSGNILFSKLLKKTAQSPDQLMKQLSHLALEGFILLYETDKGLCCERGNPIFMAEQQVRKPEKTWQRDVFTRFFNTGIEGQLEETIETKTPYFRVLAAEPTIAPDTELRTIDIDVNIPPPGEVMPIDKVTELVRKEAKRIGVAKCFCRLTKKYLDSGCDHSLETCFVFNDLAHTLIEYGAAREIDFQEAMEIIEKCETEGLVHNIDNCTSNIRTLCNCCPCCCIILKSIQRGEGFAGTPSRYTARFAPDKCRACMTCITRCPTEARELKDGALAVDPKKCIGCGLCVTTCPAGANTMVLRDEKKKIPATHKRLMDKIRREAIFSIVKKKVFGRSSRP